MQMTYDQMEQAKQRLTIEAFAARQQALSSGKLMPLWLCTRPEIQQECLAKFKIAYEAWVTEELVQLVARVEEDPLARAGVLHIDQSPTD
jgi:hypothetical protein